MRACRDPRAGHAGLQDPVSISLPDGQCRICGSPSSESRFTAPPLPFGCFRGILSTARETLNQAVAHGAEITKTAMPRLWLPALVFLTTLASSSQVPSASAEIESPDLNLILQRLEDVQHQDPAQSRAYEVTREYKVFRGSDKQPTSEVMAQINFVPPDEDLQDYSGARELKGRKNSS